MNQYSLLLLPVLILEVLSAPQLISFKEGKLGVNFGGYHAGVGLGGLLGGGAGGGLFAEAGTPFGQSAKAGLGGAVDADGRSAGGLYAGATAGGNVKASAGLGGGVTGEKSVGGGYASAQAGDRFASSGLGGESSIQGSSGFSFSGSKSIGIQKEVAVQPVEVKPVYNKVKTEVEIDSKNDYELDAIPLTPVAKNGFQANTGVEAKVGVQANTQPAVLVKEVYVQPQPVVQKEIIHAHYKPHRRHHFHKTAFVGGYIGANGELIPPSPQPAPVVYKYKSVQPVIQKRIDVGAESSVRSGIGASGAVDADIYGGAGNQFGYTKQISIQSQRNPTFFADIFNIPISTLKAVGNFLGNAAGSTNISVQKTATLEAGGHIN